MNNFCNIPQSDNELVWNQKLSEEITRKLIGSYSSGRGISCSNGTCIPERDVIINLLLDLIDILFPGYSGRNNIYANNDFFAVGHLLNKVQSVLTQQITKAFSYKCTHGACNENCENHGNAVASNLISKLPEIRTILLDDAQAALDGDPATKSMDEIILAYPGFRCICVNRIAHELYLANVPLIPRVMSEYAHTATGIDIHPGASIGRHFFIDHGTGVVIGETAIIGDNVKLYQGVTLGALSFPKDSCGKLIKGNKRHPNIEDNVTIYAESTILGNVTIGHNSVIGGNVWLTESIPPYSKVTIEPTKVSIVQKTTVPPQQ